MRPNRLTAIAALPALALLAGCGGSSSGGSAEVQTSTPPTACAPVTPNPPTDGAPEVPAVEGTAPPTDLVVKDITVGHGPAAVAGATVNVYYTGVSCSDGKLFDASYVHPPLTAFPVTPLGSAPVIEGWNQGLIGVKAGGVRELVIPPSLGYGATGQGSIKPNETLIFVVQVQSVENP